MRGIIRKAFKINTWWWIIALTTIMLSIYLAFLPNVSALTPVEENELKEQIRELRIKIENIENDIQKERTTVQELEKEIDVNKELLREAKASNTGSWEEIQAVTDAENNLNESEQRLISSKAQLDSLLDTKDSFVRKINTAQSKLGADIPVSKTEIIETEIPTNSTEIIETEIPTNSTEIIETEIPTNSTEIIETEIINANVTVPVNLKRVIYDGTLSPNLADRNVGISLSQICLTLLKNDLDTTCPTYDSLLSLDSSNVDISGDFVQKDGILQRGVSSLQDNWRWYDNDSQLRVFIDPPSGMDTRIKLITIQPNFDTYLSNEGVTVKDGKITRVIYHDRYVDDKCKNATINADKLNLLLADTIFYLRNGCNPQATSFDSKEIIITNATNMDISTSQKYKDQQRLDYIKEFCIFKFKAC